MARNTSNLIDLRKKKLEDPEGLRAQCIKANRRSQEVRAARKTFRMQLQEMLTKGYVAKDGTTCVFDVKLAMRDEHKNPIRYQDAILNAQLSEAMKGNTRAFEVVRDTIGEQPVVQQEIKTEVKMSESDKLALELYGDDDSDSE